MAEHKIFINDDEHSKDVAEMGYKPEAKVRHAVRLLQEALMSEVDIYYIREQLGSIGL